MNARKPLVTLAAVCLAAPALGADDMPSANILAMGGASAAHPADNASVGINPAALGLTERYDLFAHGAWIPAEGWALGGSVADTRGGAFALGLSYTRTVTEPPYTDADLPGWIVTCDEEEDGCDDGGLPPNIKRWHEIGVGAAFPLLDRKLSLGLGGILGFADHDRTGSAFTGNLDVGLAAAPAEGLTLGLVGRNLLPLADQPGYQAGVLAGARYAYEGIGSASVDLGAVLEGEASPWQLAVGLEGEVDIVRPRVGYRLDRGTHNLAWGLGVVNEAGGFDYAMVIPLGDDFAGGSITHALSVRLFL